MAMAAAASIGACYYGNNIEACPKITRQKGLRCVVWGESGSKKKRSVALTTTSGFCRRRKSSIIRCLSYSSSSSEGKTKTQSGIEVVRNPSESQLSELGVRSWSKWGCPPSKFPWTYSSRETCYLLEGKVKVIPDDGSDEAVEIGAGDLVVFPKGLSCTWDVSEAVDKHYKFD